MISLQMWFIYSLSLSFLLVLSRDALCTLQPTFTDNSRVRKYRSLPAEAFHYIMCFSDFMDDTALSFPDARGTGSCRVPSHYIGRLTFLSSSAGNFLIGSA
jgi:hypothetical protein